MAKGQEMGRRQNENKGKMLNAADKSFVLFLKHGRPRIV